MKDFIACCGLDCEVCEARLATVNDDDALRQRVARLWTELNGVEITLRFHLPHPAVRHGQGPRDLRRMRRNGDLRKAGHDHRKQPRSAPQPAGRERPILTRARTAASQRFYLSEEVP